MKLSTTALSVVDFASKTLCEKTEKETTKKESKNIFFILIGILILIET